MLTKLQDIRKMSQKHARLETLINRVNYDSLLSEHKRQDPKKAKGIDGVSKWDYEENLDENLKNLIQRMKKFSYRPKPVLRTYIPKPNGDLRPLGIPSYEDKLVQGVMGDILTQVYECSPANYMRKIPIMKRKTPLFNMSCCPNDNKSEINERKN